MAGGRNWLVSAGQTWFLGPTDVAGFGDMWQEPRWFPSGGLKRYYFTMSQPLKNTKVGRSEFSHGSGMTPHPDSDYQTFRNLPFDVLEDKTMEFMRMTADRRTDYTDATSGGALEEGQNDLFFEKGNPDAFGPGPALVQEPQQMPSGNLPQPTYRTGVIRQD